MNNLKNEFLKNLKFLKTKGNILDINKLNDYELLFTNSKYDYKTRQVIKDIISILDIEPSLFYLIEPDLLKFFDDYNLDIYKKR